MFFQLRNVATHRAPAFDLSEIVVVSPPGIVTAIPLEPPARIVRVNPAFLSPHLEWLRRAHAEIIQRRLMAFLRNLRALEPAHRKFLPAIGQVFPAKHAKLKHLFRSQLRRESQPEFAPHRLRAVIPVPFLHPVIDLNAHRFHPPHKIRFLLVPVFALIPRTMRYLLSACLLPALLSAQTTTLTEQLGKTVLYGDIALSPNGTRVAWVQSTASTAAKQTCIRDTSESGSPVLVKIGAGERTDASPAWSPDSTTLALFSTADEKEQQQLWLVNADGSNPRQLTHLDGYAARPRWSHDGKQIAFLYIEGATGGGPLVAAPITTALSTPLSIISALPFSTWPPARCAKFHQPICIFTILIGRWTTRSS